MHDEPVSAPCESAMMVFSIGDVVQDTVQSFSPSIDGTEIEDIVA